MYRWIVARRSGPQLHTLQRFSRFEQSRDWVGLMVDREKLLADANRLRLDRAVIRKDIR